MPVCEGLIMDLGKTTLNLVTIEVIKLDDLIHFFYQQIIKIIFINRQELLFNHTNF